MRGLNNYTKNPKSAILIMIRAALFCYAGILIGSAFAAPEPSEHLRLGRPERWETLREHRGYVALHDNTRKLPLWCAYRLTPAYLKDRSGRATEFKTDDKLPEGGRAHPADYHGSGFDLGHMVPSRDMRRTDAIQESCFLLSNIVPQLPDLNRGPWKELEIRTRSWVKMSEESFVYVGPLFGVQLKTIGRGRVVVPVGFWKVVVCKKTDGWHAVGFVAPNAGGGKLEEWITTVGEIELLTGLRLFTGLPSEERERLRWAKAKGLEGW